MCSVAPIDFEAVFRAGPSPMAVLSRDFVILAVNDAYQRVSGRDRADLVGRLRGRDQTPAGTTGGSR